MKKPDWQLTATTIKCEAVDDEITIMVKPDGEARCASYARYGSTDKNAQTGLQKKTGKRGFTPKCEGPDCRRVTEYRDRIMAEEERI